ncbi:MAG: ribosome assembly RNA-binding protein YhbY [Desulfitobacteriaceae bacterium]
MLTGKQKSYLRSLGNEMEPSLILGKGGITDNVCTQASEALEANELIKGRVLPNLLESPKSVAEELTQRVEAELVQVIGRNFLLYRVSQKKKQMVLPE